GPVIVRGDPDNSPLIRRIASSNPDQIMPPPEAHKALSEDGIALLRRWVAEGAEYEEHWAFETPQKPAVPEVGRADWARTPIDRFVLAKLEAERVAPSAEADRYAL